MKINRTFKLEKAAATDPARLAIHNILITRDETKKPVAVATNGKIMAIVPVELAEIDGQVAGDGDGELGLVSPQALTQARKLAPKKAEFSEFTLNGAIEFHDGSRLPRPSEQDCGRYPNWKAVLPDATVKFTVALDPRLLLALAEAIGCDGLNVKGITLAFSDAKSPIRVTRDCAGEESGIEAPRGVLMPMMLPADLRRS